MVMSESRNGGVTVFLVRILAVKYQITLPILKGDPENT